MSKEANVASILAKIPAVFSTVLGRADCALYVSESTDFTQVLSAPYRYAPPNLAIFKNMVNELLAQWVVRLSKSPYGSPAFLVPGNWRNYFNVVDDRNVNSKVVLIRTPCLPSKKLWISLPMRLSFLC